MLQKVTCTIFVFGLYLESSTAKMHGAKQDNVSLIDKTREKIKKYICIYIFFFFFNVMCLSHNAKSVSN